MEEFKIVNVEKPLQKPIDKPLAKPADDKTEKPIVQAAEEKREKSDEFDAVESLKNKAELFGVSARQLESEFVDFKAAKLLKRLTLAVPSGADERTLKDKLQAAARLGLGGVFVTPTKIARTKELLDGSGVKIYSSILMSEPEELPKVRVYAAKAIKSAPIAGAYIPLNFSAFSAQRFKATQKELTRIGKILKGKRLTVVLELTNATQNEMIAAVKTLLDSNVCSIAVRASGVDPKIKSLLALCGSKISVEAFGNLPLAQCGTLMSFGVASTMGENVVEVGEDLLERIRSQR